MSLEYDGGDQETATLATDESITVSVESQNSNVLSVLVDDGSGGTPSEYDLTIEYYSTTVQDWFTVEELTATNSQSPTLSQDVEQQITAQKVRVTLTAGASDTYRLVQEVYDVT